MTTERKNEIWDYLPNDIRIKLQRDYIKACEAQELDPRNERIYAHRMFMQKYFGRDNMEQCNELNEANLTAQAEDKPKEPKYECGERVLYNGKAKLICKAVRYGNFFRYEVTTLYGQSPIWVNESELEPYTPASKEASKDSDLDASQDAKINVSSYLKRTIPTENSISDSKIQSESAESVETRTKEDAYFAYRLDLAKEIAVAMIGSSYTTSLAFDRYQCANVVGLANEIIKRLKETEE